MLTALHLGNFKAFAEAQHIPIRPLTLIFGANSSGKSSIIHSLLLAQHAAETGNLDVRKTRIGGDSVDLGGFREFVHRHDTHRRFTLGFELKPGGEHNATRLSNGTEHLRFNFTIGCPDNHTAGPLRPAVLAYELLVGNRPLVRLERGGKGHLYLANDQHEFLRQVSQRIEEAEKQDKEVEETERILRESCPDDEEFHLPGTRFLTSLVESCGKIPYRVDRFLPSPWKPKLDRELWHLLSSTDTDQEFDILSRILSKDYKSERFRDIWFALDDYFDEANAILRPLLGSITYLGSLRCYPSRDFSGAQDQDPNWLSGGGQAWENLRCNAALRQTVNEELKQLGFSHQLQARELVRRGSDELVRTELILVDENGTELSHRDVGVGVSQVIPAIVVAFASKDQLIAIEEPETHLHPAAQAALGDIFIKSALAEEYGRNTLLLETHSEHLILRILRRIRETSESPAPPSGVAIRPEDVAVLFVQPGPNGSKVIELPVTPDGDFGRPWPGGFFAERFQDLP